MGENRFAECAQVCQDLLDGKYGYYELEEDWFGPFTFDNNKSKEVMWSVQSQYAKALCFNGSSNAIIIIMQRTILI